MPLNISQLLHSNVWFDQPRDRDSIVQTRLTRAKYHSYCPLLSNRKGIYSTSDTSSPFPDVFRIREKHPGSPRARLPRKMTLISLLTRINPGSKGKY
jgi:hypothetical protein